MRLEQLLFSHAQSTPERIAVVDGERRISYRDLAQSVRRISNHIRKKAKPGDRVAIHLPNGIEYVQLFYAALAAGASVVPINTRLAPPEIEHILEDSKPALVLREVPPGEDGELQPQSNEDCVILYTSGTTGKAKGAVSTHANVIVQGVFQHALAFGVGAHDVYLVTTPLAHRAGVGRLANALGLGGTLVTLAKFDAAAALEVIARERVSVAGLPPTVLRLMLPELRRAPQKCASLRVVIVAAEAFPLSLLREVRELLPHTQFQAIYGMSEAAISAANQDEMLERPGTAGRPYPGVEVRIEDDELLVRGALTVMKGYFGKPDAFRDGWFPTGDLVRQDAEGYLYVIDRRKDMVVSGGYKVYSKELEQALVQHPAIEDAAVVGVPDPTYGEAVVAAVQLHEGARLSAQEVVEFCKTRLASYKKPRHVLFVEELPRNSLGKVVKRELRIRIEAALCPRPDR